MRILITLITILLVGAACGDAATTTTRPPAMPPTTQPPPTTTRPPAAFPLPEDPEVVVLRMSVGVNQPDPVAVSTGYPEFTLYGDGRIIVADRSFEAVAGLPPLVELRVSRDGMQRLVAEAARRGALDPLESYGSPEIADADGTSFEVNTGAEQARFGVYALGDTEGVTDEQAAARRDLAALRGVLRDYAGFLGDDILEPARPYAPDALIVIGGTSGSGGEYPEFPLDLSTAEVIETRVVPARCAVATGADLDAVLSALAATDTPRNWTIAGGGWHVGFRPVLPDEQPSCATVAYSG